MQNKSKPETNTLAEIERKKLQLVRMHRKIAIKLLLQSLSFSRVAEKCNEATHQLFSFSRRQTKTLVK